MSKHKNGSTRRKNRERAERRAYRARKRARELANDDEITGKAAQGDEADHDAPKQDADGIAMVPQRAAEGGRGGTEADHAAADAMGQET
jgi:hypothetical protein